MSGSSKPFQRSGGWQGFAAFQPSILEDLGLETALHDIVGEHQRSYRNARFFGGHLSRPVSLPVASALYRITQEALHKAAKHAPGAAVTITLSETANDLRLSIHDDGPGFDPTTR